MGKPELRGKKGGRRGQSFPRSVGALETLAPSLNTIAQRGGVGSQGSGEMGGQ